MTSASLSKAVFATMVMRLVHEGVLDLDKPIHQYLPKPLPAYPQTFRETTDIRSSHCEYF